MTQTRSNLLRALRPYLVRRRLIAAAGGVLSGLAAASVIAAAVVLAVGRSALVEPGVVAALVIALALLPLVRLAWPISAAEAARQIEHRFPYLQDRVATAVDLMTRPVSRAGRSERLTERVCSEATAALNSLPIARAAAPGMVRVPLMAAALGLGLAALAWAAAPAERTAPPRHSPPALAAEEAAEPETPQSPRLFDLSVVIDPPAYTGLPRQMVDEALDNIRALAGSRVTLRASCDDALARAAVNLDPGGAAELSIDSAGAMKHPFTLTGPVRWRLSAEGHGGDTVTPWRSIEVIRDATPDVRLTRPEGDLKLPLAEPVEIAAVAIDDFGVSAMGLRYRLATEERWQSLPLAIVPGTVASASARLNVSALGLRPGGELIVVAWATDNDSVTGPKTGISAPVRITVGDHAGPEGRPRPETPLQQAEREQTDALEQLQRTAEELQRQIGAALDSAAQASAGPETPDAPQQRPGLELQEAARRLQEQAGRLDQAMRRTEQELAASEQFSPELVEKVRQLQEMMRDLLDEDLRRALQALQEALTSEDFDRMRMSLEEAREAQQRFMERLEQTLSMLRQARLQSLLEQLRRAAEELAKRQRELTASSARISEGRSAQAREAEHAQRLLARDTEPLADQVDAGLPIAREVSDEIAAKLGAIADRLRREDPAGDMRQAASALNRGSPSAAQQPQEKAERALEVAAAALKELEDQVASDFTAEARRKLAEMLRDTLWLSHQQQQIRADTRRLQSQSRTDLLRDKRPVEPLRRRQATLSRATDGLAQQMAELIRKTPAVDPALGRLTSDIAQQMEQVSRDIQGADVGAALSRSREAIIALNRLAEILLETSEDLSQQSAQSALSQYMEQLRQLSQRQQDLTERTAEAESGRAEGEMPGLSPSQLAQEQAMIREALEQMMQRGAEAAGQIVDQLGGVPEEMEQVEDELKSGRIERETVERQEDILDRMLEAQRSLYQREEERPERKAERPGAWEAPPSPPALSPSLLRAPKLDVRRGQQTQRLPRGYEEMVRDYFRALGEEDRTR